MYRDAHKQAGLHPHGALVKLQPTGFFGSFLLCFHKKFEDLMYTACREGHRLCSKCGITYTPSKKEGRARVAAWISCGHPVGHLPDLSRILLLLISLFVYSVAERVSIDINRERRVTGRFRREAHPSAAADENRN